MKLYLVRHGEALSEGDDSKRSLSIYGRKQVGSVSSALKQKRVKVRRIECSTKTRAIQTAEIIAKGIGAEDLVIPREGLKPGDSLDTMLHDLKEYGEDRMLVGHLPYMERMASTLLTGSPNKLNINFYTATVLCLSGGMGFSWSLDWIIVPDPR